MRRKYTRWTNEMLFAEALKYKTRASFQNGSKTAYTRSLDRGLIDEVCSHMVIQIKPNGYWNKDTILEEALKYRTRIEFAKKSKGASTIAHKLGIIDIVCSHMDHIRHKNNFWTIAKLTEVASKYDDVRDFKASEPNAYDACKNKNLLSEVCVHMKRGSRGFNKQRSATLYYLSIQNGTAYKIGVTNTTIQKRFSSQELSTIRILKETHYEHGDDAYATEQFILKEFSYAKYTGDKLLISGNTELFNSDILGLDCAI